MYIYLLLCFLFVFLQQIPPPTLPKPKLKPYLVKTNNFKNSGVPSFISNHVISLASEERLRGGFVKVSPYILFTFTQNLFTQNLFTFTQLFVYILFQEDSHWDVKHNQAAKGFNAKTTPPSINGNGTSQQSNSVPSQKLGKY